MDTTNDETGIDPAPAQLDRINERCADIADASPAHARALIEVAGAVREVRGMLAGGRPSLEEHAVIVRLGDAIEALIDSIEREPSVDPSTKARELFADLLQLQPTATDDHGYGGDYAVDEVDALKKRARDLLVHH